MNSIELAAKGLSAVWKAEIERAIDNAKRSSLDKWWRKQFYRETAMIARMQNGPQTHRWRPRRQYWRSKR